MASLSHALLGSLLIVFLTVVPHIAHAGAWDKVGNHAAAGSGRSDGRLHVVNRRQKPRFANGPWKHAHATFYEGVPNTFGGACGYEDVVKEGYGVDTAALSNALFNNGQACGSCYEIKCVDSAQCCKPGQKSLIVTATNNCPPNNLQSADNGGWCNPPREHFDIAKPSFSRIAEEKPGIVPIMYRRIPCQKQGGIKFTITGNPYFNQVLVSNVAGAGDVASVEVKGHKNLDWTPLKRLWGQKWVTDKKMVGEKLTFRVRATDGRSSTSWQVVPETWQFGQSFHGKNFA